MLKKVWGRVMSAFVGGKSVGTLGKAAGLACAAVVFVYTAAMNTANAADVVVPDIGVDWASVGTSAGTSLGEVVIGLIGVAIAIAIVKAGIRLMRSMFA